MPFWRGYGVTPTIVDLQDGGGWDWTRGEPPKTNPAYYLRFCKSFYRMGGDLDYIRCDNRVFLTELLRRLEIRPMALSVSRGGPTGKVVD